MRTVVTRGRFRSILLELVALSQSLISAQQIVQDTQLTYDFTWSEITNGDNYGGTEHVTDSPQGTAAYTFTGTAVSVYGVTHNDGAKFTFTVDESHTQDCTCYADSDVWTFRALLCTIDGLDGSSSHDLVITQNDASGLWVALDFLEITPASSSPATSTSSHRSSSSSLRITSTSSTAKTSATEALATGTTTSSSTTSAPTAGSTTTLSSNGSLSTTSPSGTIVPPNTASTTALAHATVHSSHVSAIAGGVAGGACVIIAAVIITIVLLRRRRQRRAQNSPLYGPTGALYRPPSSFYADTHVPVSEATSSLYPQRTPSTMPQVPGSPPPVQNGYSGYSEPYEAIPVMRDARNQQWVPSLGAPVLGSYHPAHL
ncbi:hypothetical protein DL93DRAFT_2233960 [Clavulina sp. PMI_390]|nr:hypothetical protein DL93DRAFT_2233960 [Clavulina sp. PMI_390]